jgi:hypothetical protein
MMEAVHTSETSVYFNETKCCYIQKAVTFTQILVKHHNIWFGKFCHTELHNDVLKMCDNSLVSIIMRVVSVHCHLD